jgi:BMFP domain-containing protein YqiC
MQTENRFFDDLARLANSAVGTAAQIRTEFETLVKQRLERMLADMDLVPREEFEAVKEMAAKARDEQEALQARIAALEAALKAQKPAKSKPAPRRKAPES